MVLEINKGLKAWGGEGKEEGGFFVGGLQHFFGPEVFHFQETEGMLELSSLVV